jgi:hypothetical protein
MAKTDLNSIAEYYAKISDGKLERIMTTEANGLRPEVFQILENEISKRQLNPNLMKGAYAQANQYTFEEIKAYAEKLRVLPCPICHENDVKLNGTIIFTIKSMLILTFSEKKPIIACPSCLNKKNIEAVGICLGLGWWGFPWGLIKTPYYMYKNLRIKRDNLKDYSNDVMLSYTLENIGKIIAFENDQKKLREIIEK